MRRLRSNFGGGRRVGPLRCAFTLVELIMGMIVITLVMAAMAAIMTTVAQAWTNGEIGHSTPMLANQVFARVRNNLASALYIITPADGSSSSDVMYWRADDIVADGLVEAGEIALIEEDPSTNSLYFYRSLPTTQMNAGQLTAASVPYNYAALSALTPATVKSWSFIQKTALGGPGSTTGTTDPLNVTAAIFFVNNMNDSTTQLPIVEFVLTLTRDGLSQTIYNTATVRAPAKKPY